MKNDVKKKVEKLASDGKKFDTYKIAKSFNLGRILIGIVFIVLVVLLFI